MSGDFKGKTCNKGEGPEEMPACLLFQPGREPERGKIKGHKKHTNNMQNPVSSRGKRRKSSFNTRGRVLWNTQKPSGLLKPTGAIEIGVVQSKGAPRLAPRYLNSIHSLENRLASAHEGKWEN